MTIRCVYLTGDHVDSHSRKYSLKSQICSQFLQICWTETSSFIYPSPNWLDGGYLSARVWLLVNTGLKWSIIFFTYSMAFDKYGREMSQLLSVLCDTIKCSYSVLILTSWSYWSGNQSKRGYHCYIVLMTIVVAFNVKFSVSHCTSTPVLSWIRSYSKCHCNITLIRIQQH